MTDYVGYIRCSTGKQAKSGLGLDAQRTRILDHVRPDEVLEWFEDHESGSKSDRPGLEAALNLCEITGACLCVATLDRLSRDVVFLEAVKARCAAGGFDFRCADMPDADAFTLGIMIQVAAYERQKISERTSRALQAAKKRGVRLGCPLGAAAFKGRQIVGATRAGASHRASADEWAEKRRTVVEGLLAEDLSLAAVARELTARKIATRRGGEWTARSVANLVQRLGLAAA